MYNRFSQQCLIYSSILTVFFQIALFSNQSFASEEIVKEGAKYAIEKNQGKCPDQKRSCILNEIHKNAETIDNAGWKDITFRELAKTYAFENNFEKAIEVLNLIANPDTIALTIRGIGMTIAQQEHSKEDLHRMFARLQHEAGLISHPPSNAIALTYIAMAQALSGDDEGAWKTAQGMSNAALRNKAYGETAEIQAEKGKFTAAQKSIEKIESLSFRNKAYSIVSKILADNGEYKKAYNAASAIENAFRKTQSLQYILDQQAPREITFQ